MNILATLSNAFLGIGIAGLVLTMIVRIYLYRCTPKTQATWYSSVLSTGHRSAAVFIVGVVIKLIQNYGT